MNERASELHRLFWNNNSKKEEDQELLASIIYPALVADSYVHDTFYSRERHSVGLGNRDESNSFIGERIDASGRPDFKDRELLAKYEASCTNRLRIKVLDGIRELFFKVFGVQLYFLLKEGWD